MATNQSITQLAELTTPEDNDLITVVDVNDDTMGISGTNKKWLFSDMQSYNNITPWDAKVSTVAELNNAVANSKKRIYINNSITFNQNLVLLVDTLFYVGAGAQVSQNQYQINRNNKILTIEFNSYFVSNGWQWNAPNGTNDACFNTPLSGDPNQYIPIQLFNCRISNNGSGGSFDPNAKYIANNASIFGGNGNNAGIILNVQNSYLSNFFVYSPTANSNVFVAEDNTFTGNGIVFGTSSTNSNFATIGANNVINGLSVIGGNISINSKAKIMGVVSLDDSNINFNLDGQNPVIENGELNSGNISLNNTCENPCILNTNSTGTWNDNSINYQGFGNTGTIPNSVLEKLLLSVDNINLNITSKTTLLTVPTSKKCIITKIVARNVSLPLTNATFGFGFNANADNTISASTHPELTSNSVYSILYPETGATVGNAADTFGIKCTIAQGTAATISLDVYGYYL